MRFLIICTLLLSMIFPASAQVQTIRKLQYTLPQIQDSVQYVDAVNKIALLYYEQNVDSAFYYALKARDMASRLEYSKGLADANNNMGIVYDIKGNVQLALRYYNDAYNQYVEIKDSSNIVQTLMNIAMVYNISGKDVKAVDNYKKALGIGNRIAHDSIMALALYNYILQYPGDFKPDERNAQIQRAATIADKYHDVRMQLAIDQLRAENFIANNESEKGISMMKEIVARSLKMELFFFSMDLLVNLGNQHLTTDPVTAVKYYEQALSIAERKGYRLYIRSIGQKLYDYYMERGDQARAYFYGQKLIKLFEEQEEIDKGSGIDYIQYAVKDQELKSVQLKSVYSKRFLWLAIAICVLTILSIGFLWRTAILTKKTNEMLRMQFRQLETTMEALESSNENYAKVIKIVAHDLRNPIGAINSMSSMLVDESLTPEEAAEFSKLIYDSSKNCLTMIGDLLVADFNLRETELHKEELELPAFLQQVIKLLIFRAKEKNQDIVLQKPVNAIILGDRDKLSRVMSNLLINAIKFSKVGGLIQVIANQTEKGILIAVKDNGLGIPKAFADKIFDPFTASKRVGTAGEQPFGLGLYISKQIIEAHNGQIWFESEPGVATTFYILLPNVAIVKNNDDVEKVRSLS
ncbi:tetratricopeptide repeat-containing sensor histidine kinase [Dyadobacter sp. CY326]|uniref:ATP-binding protein n=1 Tax=Dyadobacter sp. CY326 TaxID=2907300 RepID=UPI001F245F21|nr:tetratricopeptide repeat-containing sensor histidine kinase [Dyadobacter sp. CY326]MCE7068064.1 tetratricopeptide repeat-containing sensor histidine kinase [Dyadobacter sp. CY326]